MEAADKDTLERELSADVMLVSLFRETSQELVYDISIIMGNIPNVFF